MTSGNFDPKLFPLLFVTLKKGVLLAPSYRVPQNYAHPPQWRQIEFLIGLRLKVCAIFVELKKRNDDSKI